MKSCHKRNVEKYSLSTSFRFTISHIFPNRSVFLATLYQILLLTSMLHNASSCSNLVVNYSIIIPMYFLSERMFSIFSVTSIRNHSSLFGVSCRVRIAAQRGTNRIIEPKNLQFNEDKRDTYTACASICRFQLDVSMYKKK